MLAKIRRMHFRDGRSLREVARQTGLSRNTIRRWLRRTEVTEPKYPGRKSKSVVDPWAEQLQHWLYADRHRALRDRRTARVMFQSIRAQGYPGSYNRVCAFVRRWREQTDPISQRSGFVPLSFSLGEAFQFDWSTEYLFWAGCAGASRSPT
jgi:transposase